MASIVLRDVPARLKREIEKRASENRRSMAQETLHIIEQALPFLSPVSSPERRVKTSGAPLSKSEVSKAIRAGRQ